VSSDIGRTSEIVLKSRETPQTCTLLSVHE
jgi:hypothetical protein